MSDEIKRCKHCGENFFDDDIINGKCKICLGLHERYRTNEVDEDDN